MSRFSILGLPALLVSAMSLPGALSSCSESSDDAGSAGASGAADAAASDANGKDGGEDTSIDSAALDPDGKEGGGDVGVDAPGIDVGTDSPEDATPQCVSNSDCHAPSGVCDTIKGKCVDCLALADCAATPGTVCSLGKCVCPTAGDTWCAPNACVDSNTSSAHCGSCGHACFGVCAAGQCADDWEPVSTGGAPSARSGHVAIWTGAEMLVWGGAASSSAGSELNDGARYHLSTRVWSSITPVGAPGARRGATAVWTGAEMIVWGGQSNGAALSTGARFDPAIGSWKPVSSLNAPLARYNHTAVWTGTRMIVWGGFDGVNQLSSGSTYDPVADSWAAIPAVAIGRMQHSAIWTGSSMIIYGGYSESAGIDTYLPAGDVAGGMSYDPGNQVWSGVVQMGQPSARASHISAFLHGKMLVWGGYNGSSSLDTGAMYDPATLAWMATNTPAPERRRYHTAVVLDNPARLVVWGGSSDTGPLNSGGVFDPSANGWETLPVVLSARWLHSAVSTGNGMILWGGRGTAGELGDGALYLPKN